MTLKAKVLSALILLVLMLLATSVAFALYYRGNAIDYKAQRDNATGNLRLANDTIIHASAMWPHSMRNTRRS